MRAWGLTASDLWEKVSDCKPSLQPTVFHHKYISTPPPPLLSPSPALTLSLMWSLSWSNTCSDRRSPRLRLRIRRSIPLAEMLTAERRCGDHQRTLSSRQLLVTE